MIRLFDLRKEKDLSQRKMADALHISQSTYHNWENGITQPSIEQLIGIAEFFGVSVDYLINNSDDLGIIKYQERFLKPDEIELLHLYNELPVNAQKSILEFIKSIKL